MTARLAYEAPTVVELGAVRDLTLVLDLQGACINLTDTVTGEVTIDNACAGVGS